MVVSFDIQWNLLVVLGDMLWPLVQSSLNLKMECLMHFGFEQKDGMNKVTEVVIIFLILRFHCFC